jgi:tRNA (adenine22-N1)-methyltransferase
VKISKRLSICLKYTEGFNKLADIGTDHALLPINAVSLGYVSSAQAIDNKQGPFVIAYSNVLKYEMNGKIEVVLGDGIKKIDNDVDCVVISGMGGSLVSDIILKDDKQNIKRFILQPNNDSNLVRKAIVDIGFHIVDELVFNDNHKTYDLIVADIGPVKYSDLEIEFGPINLIEKPYFFIQRIEKETGKLKKVLPNITTESRKNEIISRLKLLEEVIQ